MERRRVHLKDEEPVVVKVNALGPQQLGHVLELTPFPVHLDSHKITEIFTDISIHINTDTGTQCCRSGSGIGSGINHFGSGHSRSEMNLKPNFSGKKSHFLK
jgi:hypothetical protein